MDQEKGKISTRDRLLYTVVECQETVEITKKAERAFDEAILLIAEKYQSQEDVDETYAFREAITQALEFAKEEEKNTGKTVTARKIATKVLEALEIINPSGKYHFTAMRQSACTNSIAHTMTRKPTGEDEEGRSIIRGKDITIALKTYDASTARSLSTSAVKLLDILVMELTNTSTPGGRVTLPLKRYMELRGLSQVQKAREQARRDLESLAGMHIQYGDNTTSGFVSVADWGEYRNSEIRFQFGRTFMSAFLPENQFMYFPEAAFALDDRHHPHSYYFLRRINAHKRMNAGKANEDRIAASSLIQASPSFPKAYEIRNSRFIQLALEPFERDMDAIDLFDWSFQEEQKPATYDALMDAVVCIRWHHYPASKLPSVRARAKEEGAEEKPKRKPGRPRKKPDAVTAKAAAMAAAAAGVVADAAASGDGADLGVDVADVTAAIGRMVAAGAGVTADGVEAGVTAAEADAGAGMTAAEAGVTAAVEETETMGKAAASGKARTRRKRVDGQEAAETLAAAGVSAAAQG